VICAVTGAREDDRTLQGCIEPFRFGSDVSSNSKPRYSNDGLRRDMPKDEDHTSERLAVKHGGQPRGRPLRSCPPADRTGYTEVWHAVQDPSVAAKAGWIRGGEGVSEARKREERVGDSKRRMELSGWDRRSYACASPLQLLIIPGWLRFRDDGDRGNSLHDSSIMGRRRHGVVQESSGLPI
jgi:hypothetical protein